MTRDDLIRAVAERARITKHDATLAVGATFEVIAETLAGGERVDVRGFGAFAVHDSPGRTGRNPRTGAAIEIARQNRVKFREGAKLSQQVNEPVAEQQQRAG